MNISKFKCMYSVTQSRGRKHLNFLTQTKRKERYSLLSSYSYFKKFSLNIVCWAQLLLTIVRHTGLGLWTLGLGAIYLFPLHLSLFI